MNHKHSTYILIIILVLLVSTITISIGSDELDEVCNENNKILQRISGVWKCQNNTINNSLWNRTGTNTYLINSGDDVGIGTSIPLGSLHVTDGTLSGGTPIVNGQELVLDSSSATGMTMLGGTASTLRMLFGDSGSAVQGIIEYRNSGDAFIISTDAKNALTIDSDQEVGIGIITPSYPLHVVGNFSGISIYSEANISAAGYITRTDVYNGLNALDEIKDKSFYLNPDNSINHNVFGYSSVSYKKEVVDYYINKSYNYDFFNETTNKTITITEYYQEPIMKKIDEEGIDLVKEVAMLKQAIYELKTRLEVIEK